MDCPWTCSVCLVLVLRDCTLAGAAIFLPCHEWLLYSSPLRSICPCSSLTSSAWQSCHAPISSRTVIRPCLFRFSFCASVVVFVIICVSFLSWLHLLKKGTATSVCHVHLCPCVMDLHGSKIMFSALLSTLPDNCYYPIFLLSTKSVFSENCPKRLQYPSPSHNS